MKPRRGVSLYFLLMIALLAAMIIPNFFMNTGEKYSKVELKDDIKAEKIIKASITPSKISPTGEVVFTLTDGKTKVLYVNDVVEIEKYLTDAGISNLYVNKVEEDSWFMNNLLPLVICVVLMVFLMTIMSGGGGGNSTNSKMMNFGKSRAKMTKDGKINFKDVAGLREEKEEMQEVVEFLKDPEKFTKVGARIPTGILMEGAPGTGKTLLAKAIAGEAGVPFFSISGSDFVEMFVGVGASRVRDLFEDAKKNAPCIVFIDEIDAVARRRGTGLGGGHDEREQTLNQLLVEMDGFEENSGIIVMAATNRVDILDPAILRPGRFDRKITVSLPDVAGREEILGVHTKNKPLAEDVDLKRVAQTTAGFTGADLENLLNESAIAAAKNDRAYIVQKDIEQSFIKIGMGVEKKSRVVTEDEKKLTAYHEAGHAILFHVLPKMDPVYMISIIPTGLGAGGFTMPLPEKDDMYLTKSEIEQNIMVALGGRIAEELIFEDISTGASNDIKQATKRARSMVTKYGMSDKLGMINYESDDSEVFIGRDLAHAKSFSESISGQIDEEVKRIVDDCYAKAKAIIMDNMEVLHSCAKLLLEKERIGREEFEALFKKADDIFETSTGSIF